MDARKSFLIRIDPKLYKELEAWAHSEMRSVNGQVEFLLKQAADKRKGKSQVGERTKGAGGSD